MNVVLVVCNRIRLDIVIEAMLFILQLLQFPAIIFSCKAGTADPATMERIQSGIQGALNDHALTQ